MSNPTKTIEERVGILEVLQEETMKRVARIEYFFLTILVGVVATLLSVWLKK